MSASLSLAKFDEIDARLFEQTGLTAAPYVGLLPFASSIDVLGIRVIDLAKKWGGTSAAFENLASKIRLTFLGFQVGIEECVNFNEEGVSPLSINLTLAELKGFRVEIKEFIDSKTSSDEEFSTALQKVIFLVERRLKINPLDHLIDRFAIEERKFDLVDGVSIDRFVLHIREWYKALCKVHSFSDEKIELFFSQIEPFSGVLGLKDRLIKEQLIADFLWDIQVTRTQLHVDLKKTGVRDCAHIALKYRVMCLVFAKIRRLAAACEQVINNEELSLKGVQRFNFDPTLKSAFDLAFKSLMGCGKIIFAKKSQFAKSPCCRDSADNFFEAISHSLSTVHRRMQHAPITLINYLSELVRLWAGEVDVTLKLSFNAFYLKKEFEHFSANPEFEVLSSAFDDLYLECSRNIEGAALKKEALQKKEVILKKEAIRKEKAILIEEAILSENALIKKTLEELAPFLRVWMMFYIILPSVSDGVVTDALNPLKDDIYGLIKQRLRVCSTHFKVDPSPAEAAMTVFPVEFEPFLEDPKVRDLFSHVFGALDVTERAIF